jgi:hypothetical protein
VRDIPDKFEVSFDLIMNNFDEIYDGPFDRFLVRVDLVFERSQYLHYKRVQIVCEFLDNPRLIMMPLGY